MRLSSFDYNLPKNLIAQKPAKPRDSSRLLVLDKKNGKIEHLHFYNLPQFLKKGDVLVFNDSRVIPARLWVRKKQTGGKIEILLLRKVGTDKWEALLGGKGIREGLELEMQIVKCKMQSDNAKFKIRKLEIEVLEKLDNGIWQIRFSRKGKELDKLIEKFGETPTPPYIKQLSNLKEYQTIYAENKGSIAAPTAGFHFTKRLMNQLRKMGVQFEFVTLHIGLGTFVPVKEKKIEKHQMHPEWVEIKKQVAQKLNQAFKEKRIIIVVGTTTARALEASFKNGKIRPFSDWVNIFIYPGYKFRVVKNLLTNFHLPKSTLLMLVSALAGKAKIKKAYREAIKKKYRFYSFGDAMLII